MVLADFEANQIAVIERPRTHGVTEEYYQFDEGQASIRFDNEEAIVIPKTIDSAFIIDRSREFRRFPIRPGSAKQLYEDSITMSGDEFISLVETFRIDKRKTPVGPKNSDGG